VESQKEEVLQEKLQCYKTEITKQNFEGQKSNQQRILIEIRPQLPKTFFLTNNEKK
jgi:hypothetical protein